jgi:hypothetical protein
MKTFCSFNGFSIQVFVVQSMSWSINCTYSKCACWLPSSRLLGSYDCCLHILNSGKPQASVELDPRPQSGSMGSPVVLVHFLGSNRTWHRRLWRYWSLYVSFNPSTIIHTDRKKGVGSPPIELASSSTSSPAG